MNEEDNHLEKQIMKMIKNVLVDEDSDDETKIEKDDVLINHKLLDLSSPAYIKSENSVNTKNVEISTKEEESYSNHKMNKDFIEKSPKGFHIITTFPSQNSLYNNLNLKTIINYNNVTNAEVYYNSYFHSDLSGIFSSNNSNQSFTYSETQPVKKRSRIFSEEIPFIGQDNIIESKMMTIDYIDDEVYETLRGKFLDIITNQNSSRVLQNCLSNMSPSILSKILLEVTNKISELMIDLYANYFFQKFYGFLSENDRILFLNEIKNKIVSIANNKIGTYPLQAVIDKMKMPIEREILIDSVKGRVMEMCKDQNGVHVIEKIILCFNEDDIQIIYESLIESFEVLANNSNGLCVAKLVILCKNPFNSKKLHKKIIENALVLVQNPYGNYAIQKALENWNTEETEPLIKQFCNKFYEFSKHKYSSNAVEKSLDRGGESIMTKFIDEISFMNRVVELMKNEYGNFVIQKALRLSQNQNRKRLVKLIEKNVEKIGDKKLILKWKTIVSSFTNNSSNSNQNLKVIYDNQIERNTNSYKRSINSNNLNPNIKFNDYITQGNSKFSINDSQNHKSLSTTNLPNTYISSTKQI